MVMWVPAAVSGVPDTPAWEAVYSTQSQTGSQPPHDAGGTPRIGEALSPTAVALSRERANSASAIKVQLNPRSTAPVETRSTPPQTPPSEAGAGETTAHVQAPPALAALDSRGRLVCLNQPARRVVTLAPHATELVLWAGGADRLVGSVAGPGLAPLPGGVRAVGDARRINPEVLMLLRPELIVAWTPLSSHHVVQAQSAFAPNPSSYPAPHVTSTSSPGQTGPAPSQRTGGRAEVDAGINLDEACRQQRRAAVVSQARQPLDRVLDALNVAVFYSQPRRLDDIPQQIEQLGRLLGTEIQAQEAAAGLRRKLDQLRHEHQHRPRLRVFVQAGQDPLYTLNGQHIVTHALRTCGGENVFGHLPAPAPVVGVEAVLHERPDVIVAARTKSGFPDAQSHWARFAGVLPAARPDLLVLIDEDLLYRPGPGLIAATEQICAAFLRYRNANSQ